MGWLPSACKKTMDIACKTKKLLPPHVEKSRARPRRPNSRHRWLIFQKTASSQKRLHRNSVQNGPIERSTALTGTIFVPVSVFVLRDNFCNPWPNRVNRTAGTGEPREPANRANQTGPANRTGPENRTASKNEPARTAAILH